MAVTILFYSALHYVDAVLAVSVFDPEDHKERKAQMGVNDTTKRITRNTAKLKRLAGMLDTLRCR